MRSNTGILRQARQRLVDGNVPIENQERLLDLLNLLMIALDDDAINNGNFSSRLLDVMSNHGDLLLLLQSQANELDAIKRISLNLTSSLDLQAVLDGVVNEALLLVKDAYDAHIYLYQDNKLIFGASMNKSGEKNIEFAKPRRGGLTDSVATRKEIIIVEDMADHPLYSGVPNTWLGSIIGIPLKMGTRVVGVMNLARTRSGEFSPSEIRLLTLLSDQAAIAIINARLHSAVNQLARLDMLTNLPNRRALDERLDKAITNSLDSGEPFTVVMMDLDNFKVINDTYGHDVGDDVLKQVASIMGHTLRSSDFLARYGGDELTLVLTGTSMAQALVVIQKIQDSLRNTSIHLPDGKDTNMSVSGGIALYPLHAETAPSLIRAADEALYRAKKTTPGQFLPAQNGVK